MEATAIRDGRLKVERVRARRGSAEVVEVHPVDWVGDDGGVERPVDEAADLGSTAGWVEPSVAERAEVLSRAAVVNLVSSAMMSGLMYGLDQAENGRIDPGAPLGDVFTEYSEEFVDIRSELVDALLAGGAE